MAKKIFLTVLMCLTFSSLGFASSLVRADPIQKLITDEIQKYNIPGIVVSIKYPNQPIKTYFAGFSDLEKHTSMSSNTLFPIGSITKSFIGVLALKLQEEHQLKLTDTLNKLAMPGDTLSKLIKQHPFLKNITLYQLLTHTSGLPDFLNSRLYNEKFEKYPTRHWTDEELLNSALKLPMLQQNKNNKYSYSNTDYVLAGIAMESVTKKSLKILLDNLFQQAHLKNIYYPLSATSPIPEYIKIHLAHGYIDEQTNWPKMIVYRSYPSIMIPGVKPLKGYDITQLALIINQQFPASGAIISNTQTMAQWFSELFNSRIISKSSAQTAVTGVKTPFNFKYGLGISIRFSSYFNSMLYSHNGSQLGYQTNLIYLKNQNIVIAITINSDSDKISDPEKWIAKDIISNLLQKKK